MSSNPQQVQNVKCIGTRTLYTQQKSAPFSNWSTVLHESLEILTRTTLTQKGYLQRATWLVVSLLLTLYLCMAPGNLITVTVTNAIKNAIMKQPSYVSNYCPLTNLLISFSLSGAVLEVALIILEVCISDSFLMQRCPGTRLHTCSRGTEEE